MRFSVKNTEAYVSFYILPSPVDILRDRRVIFPWNIGFGIFFIKKYSDILAKNEASAIGWSDRRWLFAGICGKI